MNSIHVHPNILKPYQGRHLTGDVAGWSLRQVAREFVPKDWGTSPIRCAVNGRGYPERMFDEITVGAGDDVIVSKDVLGIELTVGGILTALAYAAITTAVNIGVAYAIQALQGRPRRARTPSDLDSPTYRIGGPIQTSYGSGLPIPLPYGRLRVGGQVLGQSLTGFGTSDVYNVLLGLGRGPISSIAGINLETRQEYNRLGSLYGSQFGIQPIPQGIRVNRVPLQMSDASVTLRAGTMHQSPAPALVPRGSNVQSVGKPLRQNVAQSATLAATTRMVRLRVVFESGLFAVRSDGGLDLYTVLFDVRFFNASNQQVGASLQGSTVNRTRAPFASEVLRASVPATATRVQISRTTTDDDQYHQSSCTWESVVEEFDSAELAYPGIALLGLEFRATEQLAGSVNEFTTLIDGRLLRWRDGGVWQEPAFLHSASGRYIGRNPAWIACDFLTNRYGLGLFVNDTMLDLDALQDWGEYNDELVDDGHGGTHPRAHCDLILDQSRKAMDWLIDICRTGRGFPFWFGDRISFKFSRPTTSVTFPNPIRAIIAESNCAELRIESTEVKHRPTIFDAQIYNEELDFQLDPVTVRDPGALYINEPWRLGAEPPLRQNRDLPGIVRPQQAKRDLLWEHAVNRLRTWIAHGVTGIDSFALEPGDLIVIQQDFPKWFDNETAGYRTTRAGSAVTNVFLDHEVVLAPATTYEMLIVRDDAVPQTAIVNAAPGTYPKDTAISVTAPVTYTKAGVVALGVQNMIGRVFEIREYELREDLTVAWKAQYWDDEAFNQPTPLPNDELDGGIESPFSAEVSDTVTSVRVTPTGDGRQVIAWQYPALNNRKARVYLRLANRASVDVGGIVRNENVDAGWLRLYEGDQNEAVVEGLSPFVEYEIAVVLADRDGQWGMPSASAVSVTTEEFSPLPPPSIQGLRASRTEAGPELRWVAVEGVRDYEIRRGSIWLGGQLVARTTEPRLLVADAPVGGQTYLVAARAHNGLYSPVIAQISVNVDPPAAWPAADITVLDLAPTAGGTHDGTEIAADGILRLQYARICGIYTLPIVDPGRSGPYWWSLNWSWRWRDISGDGLLVAVGSGESHWWRSGPDGDGREATVGKPGVDFDLRLDGDGVVGGFSPGFSDGFATGPSDIYSRALSSTDAAKVTLAGPFGATGSHARVVAEVRWDEGTGTFGKWERWRNQVRTAARAQIRFLLDRESASRFEVFLDPWIMACACAKTFSAEFSFTGADGPQQRFTVTNPAVKTDSRIVGNAIRPNVTEEEDDGVRYVAQVLTRQSGSFDVLVCAEDLDGTEPQPVPSETVEYHYTVG